MSDAPTQKPSGPRTVYVKAQTALGGFLFPVGADAIITTEDELDALSKPDQEEVDESRQDRGTRARDKGNLNAVPWSLTRRLIGTGTGGATGADFAPARALDLEAAGLRRVVASSSSAVTVVDYIQAGTIDVTVTDANGVVVKHEDVTFVRETSNNATATNMAAAINALAGVAATATGAVVTVTLDADRRDLLVESSATAFATLVMADDRALYVADNAEPALAVSITAIDRQQLSGVYYVDAIAQEVQLSKPAVTDYPRIKHTGLASRRIEIDATTLGALLTDVAASMTVSNPDRFRTGLGLQTETLPSILMDILDTNGAIAETVALGAMDWTAGTIAITRAQASTSAVEHANGSIVRPHRPVPVYAEQGLAIGSTAADTTATIDGAAVRIRGYTKTLKTGRAFDEHQTSVVYQDTVHNETMELDCDLDFMRNLTRQEHVRKVERGVHVALVINHGSVAGSSYGIRVPLAFPSDSEGPQQRNAPTTTKITFRGDDNVTGTTPGLSGKLQYWRA